jgi:hypothetical protein
MDHHDTRSKERESKLKKSFYILFFVVLAIWLVAGCGGSIALQPANAQTEEGAGAAIDRPPTIQLEETDPLELSESDNQEDNDIRALLEKGAGIRNISCTAKFNNIENEYVYEFYKRRNLSKTVIRDGDHQSVTISDGQSKVYYSLPDKIGFTMRGTDSDFELIPNIDALLEEEIYIYRIVGEEQLSGYLCLVAEVESDYGALKIWISKSLGLPIKYIGTDDNGWYSLELTEIQLGEPPESVFAVPSDIIMN